MANLTGCHGNTRVAMVTAVVFFKKKTTMHARAHARPHAGDRGGTIRIPHSHGKQAVPPDGLALGILYQDYASKHPVPAWHPDFRPAWSHPDPRPGS